MFVAASSAMTTAFVAPGPVPIGRRKSGTLTRATRPSGAPSCHPRTRRRPCASLDQAARATPKAPAGAAKTPPSVPLSTPGAETGRIATATRKTAETSVSVTLNLDGTGRCDVDTGIPFLDHMLHQLASHGLIDMHVRADGDTWIDDHHTNEDIGITLGLALRDAVGQARGIRRFGNFVAPLDEALVEVVLDFSGRGHCEYGLIMPTQRVGTYDTQLVREFFHAVATNAQITLHVIPRAGVNTHHIIESAFKAFARALRIAVEDDPRRTGVPSSKGTLSDDAARV